MDLLRKLALDLLVTLLIALSLWKPASGLIIGLSAYMVLMALLKIGVLTSPSLLRLAYGGKNAAPPLAFHLLYGTNVVLSAVAGRWWWVGLWALIWFLSFLGLQKASRMTASVPGKAGHRSPGKKRAGGGKKKKRRR
ncbi:MAG: hypothetical protein D6715_08225 [Calditrichaeota bacterium]|nr:MAG: hypothetical protein D6715_08225 [Calditrichota bacterium]